MRPSERQALRKSLEGNEPDGGAGEASGSQASASLGAAKPRQAQAGRKRALGKADGAPARQRRRSASPASASADADPIESADEESDGGAEQLSGRAADEAQTSWDDDEEADEEEQPRKQPQRQSSRARRTAGQRQALAEEGESGGEAGSEAEEDGRRRVPRRAAAAVKPNYRVDAGDDEDEEMGDDDEEEGGEEEEASEMQPSGEEESEEGSESEEEEESKPRRRQPTRQAAGRGGKRGTPAGARRTGRSRARVNYNLDAMEAEYEEEEESSSSSEDEQEDGENARPTRRAAKLAGKAIRQQAGSGGKRRKQPKRAAAAPAKRRNVVDDDDDDDEEEEDKRGSGSGSGSDDDAGSGSDGERDSDAGSEEEEEGSEGSDDVDLDGNHVEKILESRAAADGTGEEFLCKFEGMSYRKVRWLPYNVLAADRLQLLRNFQKKKAAGEVDMYGDLDDGVHPEWREVDRVIAQRTRAGRPLYLVKWKGLGYGESTWETERELSSHEDKERVARFKRHNELLEEEEVSQERELDTDKVPDFCNGRQLRDYQKKSLEWNITNWAAQRNCILGDEMGLGKTAQSISVLAYQRQFGGTRGPFLVIAPLTTLGHWQREIETWSDMNCVVYAGGAADKALIQKYDLFFPASTADRGRRRRQVKPNVVLVSYETVLKDKGLFMDIVWETVIIDEAHRMKSTGSSTRAVIASMQINWLLLLTGTPVQNNMRELFGILNLLDPVKFGDEEEFLEEFGDERAGMTPDQVRALQMELRPILLRRMKEDVETLPEKEEVIIWVELTPEQRAYYRAIYEQEIGTLLAGASSKNMPNMRNLAMELRKVCCHPYLCNGLEEDIQRRKLEAGVEASEIEQLVAASGKMVLLHKLLPKLKKEGRKVLIFSQFKIMLDVLEDYLRLAGHHCERIDGSTSSRDRQAAIDRFSKEDSEGFVFLLSTRAGGQGITLTAADTCIIYDSDWNPQNDLQAMARCHRIGQDKEVTIYRLVSKNTYEQNVFEISSRKYGLDEAILGNLGAGGSSDTSGSGGGGNPEEDSRKIAELLKHGAHCLHAMDGANEQSGEFAAEGIDEILQGRTEKRQIGGRAGNTFSVATFAVGPSTASGEGGADDRSYWTSLLPGAVDEHEKRQAAKRAPVVLAPRARKQVDYKGQLTGRVALQASQGGDEDADYVVEGSAEQEEDDDLLVLPKGKRGGKKGGKQGSGASAGEEGPSWKRWTHAEVAEFLHRLVQLGEGRIDRVRQEADLQDRTPEECAELEAGVLRALSQAGALQAAHEAEAARRAALERQQQLGLTAAEAGPAGAAAAAAAAAASGGQAAGEAAVGSKEGGQDGEGEAGTEDAAAAAAVAAAAVDKSKKAKDRSVATALAAWIDAEMADAPPHVLQALRGKSFLDYSNTQASKALQALRHRKQLAHWVVRIRTETAAEKEGQAQGAEQERSPARRTLPWLKSKTPSGWRGGWHDSDTQALMEGLHELGWVARKGKHQSELLDALLTDERFGFHTRVQRRPAADPTSPSKPAPGASAGPEVQQQQQQAGDAQPMDVDHAQQRQQAAMDKAGPAAAAGASPQVSPTKAKQGPRKLDDKEWAALCKGLANFINGVLLPALEQAAPMRYAGPSKARPAAAPAGLHRADSTHGSSADLQQGGQVKQKKQLAKQAAANAATAAAAAAAGTTAGTAGQQEADVDHITQSSDATPPGAAGIAGKGKAPAAAAAAAGYTNPLTSAGTGAGDSGSKPRKAPLALHPSTGPKAAKGHKTQINIMSFFNKKPQKQQHVAAAAAPGAGTAAQESPGGRKENEQQQQAQHEAGQAGGSKAPAVARAQEEVVVIE